MDIDAPKQKVGKFMSIISSIKQKLPDRQLICYGLVGFLFWLVFAGCMFGMLLAKLNEDHRSLVTFDYGNGKQITLLIEPKHKISLIESQLRNELNLSSKYVVDLFVKNYKLDSEKNLHDYKLMKISSNDASPIPIINVRFSCPGCPKTEQVMTNSDHSSDVNSKILSRIDDLEKLLMKYIQIHEKNNSRRVIL